VEHILTMLGTISIYLSIYLSMALQPFVGSWPLFHFLDHTQSRYDLFEGDQPVAWPLPTQDSLLTYLGSGALPEKLPIVQPLKNFPAFYGTRRFITVFTRALHWSLSCHYPKNQSMSEASCDFS
jgi:hypothetical protein